MGWALGVAKSAKGVEVKTGGLRDAARHDKNGKIARWNATRT